MTNTATRSMIAAADLKRIAAELEEAQADLTLLERLKSAQDRVDRLTAEQDKTTKELNRATAAEAKAGKARRFDSISDLYVTESPDTLREHVLRSSFTVHWTRPTWNGRASPPTKHSIAGFGACPPDVLDCLIERCPDRIPGKIMALAPDEPREAFGRYFAGLRRGCFIG